MSGNNRTERTEYKRIAEEITRRVHQGLYPSNSFLPSENQLAGEFGVTRQTVRQALNILKSQGTIESYQGKGYQVKSLYWEQSLLQFYSFGRSIAGRLDDARTRVISCKRKAGAGELAAGAFSEDELWEIVRLRIIHQVPLILETSLIPVKLLPEITEKELYQKSLYDLLEGEGVHIIRAKEYLEPVIPAVEAGKLLQVDASTPLFKTVRYTYDSEGELVELRDSLIRGDHFRFSVEMTL